MAFLLGGTTIKGPGRITEGNSTQTAQQRTLSGAISRDMFGSNKRVWELEYENVNPTDYNTIKTKHTAYLTTGTVSTFESTEANYTVASTSVHIDIQQRGFKVRGSSYISDFTLILTEA